MDILRAATLILFVVLPLFSIPGTSLADEIDDLKPNERAAIEYRVGRTYKNKRNLRIERGDTAFIVVRKTVNRKVLPGRSIDYEGIIGGIETDNGIILGKHIDRVSFEPGPKGKVIVEFRYSIAVSPERKKNGSASFRLSLVRRKGFGGATVSFDVKHLVHVRRPIFNADRLLTDFRAFRVYRQLAAQYMAALSQRGVRGLSLAENVPLPAIIDNQDVVIKGATKFSQWKRRMWIAHRHLIAASKVGDKEISQIAKSYLSSLDKSKVQIEHILRKSINLSRITSSKREALATAETDPVIASQESVVERSVSAEKSDIVQPLANRSTSVTLKRPTRSVTRLKPENTAKVSNKPSAITPSQDVVSTADSSAAVTLESNVDFRNREKRIPSHPRFLRLEDANISLSAAVSVNYQEVTTTESAVVPTMYSELEIPLTNDVGFSFTLPLAVVNVDLPRTKQITTIGNPQVKAKYRLNLPELAGSRPLVVASVLWAIPASHGQNVSPTTLSAEEFILAAQFTETSAFLFEKHAVGASVATSILVGPLQLGGQFQFEYLVPIVDGNTSTAFSTLSYGVGVGYHPFGELLSVFVESKGAALIIGPRRNEVATYAGIRSQLFDVFELAAWGAVIVAPNARPTSLGVGAELRFVYDIDNVIIFGSSSRKFGEGEWTK
ncbi:MAG: hypothetical protein VYC39_04310 [Myxococcota bacterium]|nr:hypothetical protein [Myxococcota bacterium]